MWKVGSSIRQAFCHTSSKLILGRQTRSWSAAPRQNLTYDHQEGILRLYRFRTLTKASTERSLSIEDAKERVVHSSEWEGLSTYGSLDVQRIPCLSDNYAWLIQDKSSSKTAIVDPSEAGPVLKALEERSLKLDYILNTHHHWDHVGGNEDLKRVTGAFVIGPKADSDRIPGIDQGLEEGDTWMIGDSKLKCFETPGHTLHGLAFHFESADVIFTGDTLFSLGCGRLFEGTPAQMYESLTKLQTHVPDRTWHFPGHEYTQSNAKFALGLEPGNKALQQRSQEIDRLRSQNQATVPSLMAVELETNPFLRSGEKEIKTKLGLEQSASELEVFTAMRAAKDKA